VSGNADRPEGAPPGKEPDAQTVEQALTMLAEGTSVTDVAEHFGVARKTVRAWRDCPAGQKRLHELRAERARFFRDAVEHGRKRLRELVMPAVETLGENLESTVPFESATAAQAILDRAGLPKSTVVEQPKSTRYDLSRLNDKDAAEFERLALLAAVEDDA
jgi:transposase-like protein